MACTCFGPDSRVHDQPPSNIACGSATSQNQDQARTAGRAICANVFDRIACFCDVLPCEEKSDVAELITTSDTSAAESKSSRAIPLRMPQSPCVAVVLLKPLAAPDAQVELQHECDGTLVCRLGVLIEVNCETDFVARGAKFKELVQDMAMQAAASPSAIVVAVQDVPEQEIEKERAIEMGKEDIQSKPEAIRLVSIN